MTMQYKVVGLECIVTWHQSGRPLHNKEHKGKLTKETRNSSHRENKNLNGEGLNDTIVLPNPFETNDLSSNKQYHYQNLINRINKSTNHRILHSIMFSPDKIYLVLINTVLTSVPQILQSTIMGCGRPTQWQKEKTKTISMI